MPKSIGASSTDAIPMVLWGEEGFYPVSPAGPHTLKHFGRFGAPHQLRSDNDPHFIAEVIREFLHLIGRSEERRVGKEC